MYRALAMRNRTRTALAALALGLIAAGPPSLAAAQPIESAEALSTASPHEITDAQPAAVPAETAEAVSTAPPDEITDAQTDAQSAPPDETAEEAASTAAPDEIADEESVAADETADAVRPASDAVVQVIHWVITSGDNGGLPFVVVDKEAALVFIFDAEAQFLGATPALLGSAYGDDSASGVGDKKLSAIAPDERTTPAGRFLAGFGRTGGKHKVLWVDYANAISLHPVVTANKKEHRLERLQSASPADNRITYGCINISAAFYAKVVSPLFEGTNGVVYILPETRPLDEVFSTLHSQVQALGPEPQRPADQPAG
jgi:hypothetical protein